MLTEQLTVDALILERICARGWPGIEQEWQGEWLLRAGHGFTGRANSVLVLGRPGAELPTAIEHARAWYAARTLPARFQLPTGAVGPALQEIDAELSDRGWQQFDDVVVLVADVRSVRDQLPPPLAGLRVTIDEHPDPTWLSLYEYRGKSLPPTAIEVLRAGTSPFFVTLYDGTDPVAVTRGCVTDGWMGITAVTVPSRFRRRGFGTEVLRAAVSRAESLGAQGGYLQVSRDNAGALALYRGLGFVEHHGYHYRDRP
ncbi:MAG: GNAT family N-acetyltransferase [Nakamurella sp.]